MHHSSEDLGYFVGTEDSFEPIEVISPRQLVSSVVTGSFVMRSSGQRLRMLVSYDKVGHEIFEDPNAEDGDVEGVA